MDILLRYRGRDVYRSDVAFIQDLINAHPDQSRFLILPWVRVPHLASHLLGRMSRQLSADWQRVYAHPVYFTETFVDPTRYAGTCYGAANWIYLGMTTGRGKNDQTMKPNRTLKQVYGQVPGNRRPCPA